MTNQLYEKPVHAKFIVDLDNKEQLPKRFRTTSDSVNKEENESINLEGLKDLKSSGSGMFSQKGLIKIKQEIGDYPITVVDLRQESHGFVNGMAVSWFGKWNYANKKLNQNEVLEVEKKQLSDLDYLDSISFDYIEGKSVHMSEPIEDPKVIQTEEEVVKQEGLNYKRFCVTDHNMPSATIIDEFVNFVKCLPENTWLHFHCRGGVGRTTTFMILYDMMKHVPKVSCSDILSRQKLIGGRDMYRLAEGTYKHTAAVERLAFILNFYEYCLANYKDDFSMSWSEWLENK